MRSNTFLCAPCGTRVLTCACFGINLSHALPVPTHGMAAFGLFLLASASSASAVQISASLREARAAIHPGATRVQLLHNENDAAYYADLVVGGQRMRAIPDTGSFELLVFGKNCTVCGRTLYDHSMSHVANVTSVQTTHSYGSGTAYSVMAFDTFMVAGLPVPKQQFWEVVSADMYVLMAGAFQSIFGVGPPESAVRFAEKDREEVEMELEEMRREGEAITPRVMATVAHYRHMVDIQKQSTGVIKNLGVKTMSFCFGSQSGSPGHLLWDDHAPTESPEKFLTLNVVGDLYWSAEMSAVRLEHASAPASATPAQKAKLSAPHVLGCQNGNCSAILDTGTSLISAPSSVLDAVWQLADTWEKAGGTCGDLSGLPDLNFKLNGHDFSLPPESYMGVSTGELITSMQKYMPQLHKKLQLRKQMMQKRKEATNHTLLEVDADEHGTDSPLSWGDEESTCSPLLMKLDSDCQFGQMWVLGMPFYRTYYTTYHFNHEGMQRPAATSMSFSAADSTCRPGSPPGAKVGDRFVAEGFGTSDAESRAPRPATMRVNVGKLRVPNFRKRHHLRDAVSSAGDVQDVDRKPFYRI